VVVDIGTGVGIFALIACRLGARRVFAIEPNEAIQVARDIAAANGYSDRIQFIQDLSTRVTLPEPAHVVVSDIGGALPLFQNHLAAIIDARRRLLAPGGVLIPEADTLWAAIGESPQYYDELAVWDEHSYGFDMSAARELACNDWWKEGRPAGRLLTQPTRWATLDYRTLTDVNAAGELERTVLRAGTAHALFVWWKRRFAAGIELSDYRRRTSIYRRGIFPLSQPVPVARGDAVRCSIQATLIDGDYVWRWRTQIAEGTTGRLKADFHQTTLAGFPLSPRAVEKASATYVPALTPEGEADWLALDLMRKGSTLAEISKRLAARFPDQFESPDEALRRVASLSRRYSR